MSRKTARKCVECRYCATQTDARGRTRNVCLHHPKRRLPANLSSRPACGKLKPPRPHEHWGA